MLDTYKALAEDLQRCRERAARRAAERDAMLDLRRDSAQQSEPDIQHSQSREPLDHVGVATMSQSRSPTNVVEIQDSSSNSSTARPSSRPLSNRPKAPSSARPLVGSNKSLENCNDSTQSNKRASISDSDGQRMAIDEPRRKRISTGPATSSNAADSLNQLQPPKWYQDLKRSTKRLSVPSSVDNKLEHLKTMIRNCCESERLGPRHPAYVTVGYWASIGDVIHDAMFFTVGRQLLRNHNLLNTETGLPVLFQKPLFVGPQHSYVSADAEELYNRWCAEVFVPDLMRGIIIGKGKNVDLGRDKSTSDSLDPSYIDRVKGTFFGNGKLVQGQWWPTQLTAVRDGAHNSAQAGISGRAGEGAYSIVISGDEKYPDKDEGEELWYCGTDSEEPGVKTAHTSLMIESVDKQQSVRVLRSQNAKNKVLAPRAGFRYDGLYQVLGYEVLDRKIQRHRFQLRRLPGQGPIRAGAGPDARPTQQELDAYNLLKKEKKFLV